MKRNIFKAIAIAYLLLTGNVSFANDVKAPAAKASDTGKTGDAPKTSSDAKEADEPKVEVGKLNSGAKGRAIGSLLANKAKPAAAAANADSQKRIEELEELVEEQKKLIEMYKNQSK